MSGDLTVAIIGMGYVGLPLSLSFVEAGVKVIGIDVDPSKVEQISRGESYLVTTPSARVKAGMETGLLTPSAKHADAAKADAVLLCVPTPLGKAREPDLQFVEGSCRDLVPYLRQGQLISLESSTYPGTTEEVCQPILDQSGLKLGEDYWLAYSPEREDPGNHNFSTSTTPKLVGGLDQFSGELAAAVYRRCISKVILVSHARIAEAAKLTENIYRAVNIGLVNELKVVFEALGIDVWEVLEAAATKPFGYQAFWPGPGIGGHCIPVDPFYLTWKAAAVGEPTRFIELAGEIAWAMPRRVVRKVQDALNDQKKAIRGSKVLMLGMAYKPGISDTRESPGMEISHHLEELGAVVTYHDPLVPTVGPTRSHPVKRVGVPLNRETVQAADCVLLVTQQPGMDLALVAEHAKLIVDTRNAFAAFPQAKVIKA